MSFTKYTPGDGLANNGVVSVTQDKIGRLWISTLGGINIYNGYSFSLFTAENTNGGIAANEIVTTCNTAGGNIYFGTSGKGLTRYNMLTNSFTVDTSVNDVVTALFEDKNQTLWAATQNGYVYAINFTAGTKEKYLLEHPTNKKRFSIYDIAQISDGSMWVATDMGIFTIKNSRINYMSGFEAFNKNGSPVLARDIATEGKKVWVATKINGLFEYDISEKKITHITSETTPLKLSSDNLRNIIFKEGKLWIGTWDAGIIVIDLAVNTINYIQHDPYNDRSLSGNYIGNIFFANDGIIWVSTFDGGLNKFDPLQEQFHPVKKTYHPDGLLYPSIKNIYYHAPTQTIMLGSLSGGLYIKNKNQKGYKNYQFKDSLNSIPHNTVKYILHDKGTYFWIATLGGLGHFNTATGKSTNYYYKKDNTGLTTNRIFCLAKDYKDRLWIGTPNGISIYSDSTKKFANYFSNVEHKGSFIKGIAVNYLSEIIFRSKKYMIACTGAGIELIDIDLLAPAFHFFTGSDLSTNAEVKNTYIENDTSWWVATGGNGLLHLNPLTKKQQYYTTEDGLCNNFVYAVLSDKAGRLWLSTNDGLSCFTVEAKKFINYKKEDGLQDNEFNLNAWFNDTATGTLYFGGISGYNYFNGIQITDRLEIKTALEWKSIKVLDKEYLWEKGVLNSKQIVFRQDKENFFEIAFSCPAYRNQQNVKLKYQLKGFDKNWHIGSGECRVSYTNVPAGKYTFVVYLVADGNEKKLDEFIFIITPPWYQAYWFKIASLLLLFGTLYWIVKKRIQRIKHEATLKQKITETEMAALKAQMNPHFMFNCINSIDAFIHSNDKYNATLYLNKFAKLLRGILESSRQNTIPLSKDIETLKLYVELEELRHESKFQTQYSISNELLNSDYKVLPLIIQPFVENAILHGLKNREDNNGLLQIDIEKNDEKILYTITDNGIGREAAKQIMQNKESHYGMQMSFDRIKLFNNETQPSVNITDIYTDNKPAGTKVEVWLKII